MSETEDETLAVTVDHDAVRQGVRDEMARRGLSIASAARVSGTKDSTLGAFLNGKYAGNNDPVARTLKTWLDSLTVEAISRLVVPAARFVKTRTADAFMATLGHAQFVPDLVVIAGGAGVGKTTACEQYKRLNPNVWLITGEPSICNTFSVVKYLCDTVGVMETMSDHRSRTLVDKIVGTRGLIIVDEAQHLKTEALEQLRTIHDKAGIGLALVGNERVFSRMDGGGRAAEFAQLFSRIGMRVKRPRPLSQDVEAMLDSNEITGAKERAFLRAVANKPGALRGMVKSLRMARMLAMGDGAETVAMDHLKLAWGQLSGETTDIGA